MNQPQCFITFENCSPVQASGAAEDLKKSLLRDLSDDIIIKREPGDPRAQDIGSILSIIFTAPVINAFANTLKSWLVRRKDVAITIRNGEREVILQNITFRDVEQNLSRLACLVGLNVPEPEKKDENHAKSSE